MSGRFLSAPFVLAVSALASEIRLTTTSRAVPALAALVLLGILPGRPTVLSDGYYAATEIPVTGIADERGVYYGVTGMLRKRHEWPPPHVALLERYVAAIDRGRRAVVTDFIGMQGFLAGPRLHFIDRLGLPDPLLSRLPCEPGWRIGHFERSLPEGYFDSVERGTNAIADRALANYYERVLLITRGPIWSRARWSAIVRMNMGDYDGWLRAYVAGRRSASARRERTKIHAATAPSGNALMARTAFPGSMSPRNSSDTVAAVGTAATTSAARVRAKLNRQEANHAPSAPIAPEM